MTDTSEAVDLASRARDQRDTLDGPEGGNLI